LTIDFDDAYVSDEEDYFAYSSVATTWSGKILHSGLDIYMEKKTIKEDEASPYYVAHEEVVIDTYNKEEDKEK
ncbi:hypothetical protein HAX54_010121, partial [Datura stramonium]|nr:hypothetical protein [Datura stramonium]